MKGERSMKYQFLTCKCGWAMARMSLGRNANISHGEICRECESPMELVTDKEKIQELNDFFFKKK
jgi:hypothetical protein